MARNVYSVKQVNAYIKNMFAQDYMLNCIYVKGEVSNFKYHTSGHIYFSLKDESGTIACVMFAGQRGGLSFRMCEGQQIIVLGSVAVYERSGAYQLYAVVVTVLYVFFTMSNIPKHRAHTPFCSLLDIGGYIKVDGIPFP